MYAYDCHTENLLNQREDVPGWSLCMRGIFDWITLIVGNMLGALDTLALTGGVDSRNILNI